MKTDTRPDAISELSEAQFRRNVRIALLLCALLPPFLGGSLMGVVGFYPMPEFYLIFFSYAGPYVLIVIALAWWISSRVGHRPDPNAHGASQYQGS